MTSARAIGATLRGGARLSHADILLLLTMLFFLLNECIGVAFLAKSITYSPFLLVGIEGFLIRGAFDIGLNETAGLLAFTVLARLFCAGGSWFSRSRSVLRVFYPFACFGPGVIFSRRCGISASTAAFASKEKSIEHVTLPRIPFLPNGDLT